MDVVSAMDQVGVHERSEIVLKHVKRHLLVRSIEFIQQLLECIKQLLLRNLFVGIVVCELDQCLDHREVDRLKKSEALPILLRHALIGLLERGQH